MQMIRLLGCLIVLVALCLPVHGAQTLFSRDESVPAYAVILFDGKDTSEWLYRDGKPAGWKVENGYMEVRGGDIVTKRTFGDFQLHVEFWLPDTGQAQGQGRANSGVYLQGSYEIQVLDSYQLPTSYGDCGGIYGIATPMVNACRPPQQWQSFDILFRAPKFDDKGNKTSEARVSVLQNGVWIHDCVEVPHPTPSGVDHDVKAPGPILLQDHGSPIRYRNIWIRPLDEAKKQ
jgi:hypothetical protein